MVKASTWVSDLTNTLAHAKGMSLLLSTGVMFSFLCIHTNILCITTTIIVESFFFTFFYGYGMRQQQQQQQQRVFDVLVSHIFFDLSAFKISYLVFTTGQFDFSIYNMLLYTQQP